MRQRGSITLGLAITAGVLALMLLATATWAKRQAEKRAVAEAKMAQWQATAMECSDATAKAKADADKRAKAAQDALRRVREASKGQSEEISRLRASSASSCQGAVAEVRRGLK